MKMFAYLISLLLFASCNSKPAEPVQDEPVKAKQVEFSGVPEKLEAPDFNFIINGFNAGKASIVGIFTEQQYLVDTAIIDPSGRVTFKRSEPYQPGMAYLLLPDQSFFQFMITEDQSFSMTADKGNYVPSMKVEGSIDNEIMYQNLRFEAEFQPRLNEVSKQLSGLLPVNPEYAKVEAQQNQLVADRKQHLDEIFTQYPTSFFTKFKQAGQNPDIRDVRKKNGNIDTLRQLYIYRSQFWDNVDFSNDWLLYTPVISNKLKKYMTELTPQTADSINRSASFLSDKVIDYPEYYKYIVNWITLNYEPGKTSLMDGEAVFNHMVQDYFTYDRAFWSDSFEVYSLRRRAKEMELSLVGQKAQDMQAKDLSGNLRSIMEIEAPYIIVFMYNPTCDHCIEESPELVKFYNQWKQKGVEVYAMALDTNDKEWRDFVATNRMDQWINVYDPTNASLYGKYFVDNTPELYLLNSERTIIAKNLKVKQVAEMIDADMKKNE